MVIVVLLIERLYGSEPTSKVINKQRTKTKPQTWQQMLHRLSYNLPSLRVLIIDQFSQEIYLVSHTLSTLTN